MAIKYLHRKTLTDGSTITINVAQGYNIYKVTLGGNRTLAFSNITDKEIGILIVYQDGTGGRTLTYEGEELPLNPLPGKWTILEFFNDNGTIVWTSSAGNTSGGGDTTEPTVVSATAINSTTIRIVFSESVTATNVGWSFKKNGSAHNPSAVSGSGTNTLDFTVGAMLSSDTLLRTYDSSTGNTMDSSSNELVSFTDQSVTNSIPPSLHLSNFTAANGTAITAYTPDSGNAWAETAGDWEIQSNRATTAGSPPASNNWITLTDLGSANHTIAVVGKRTNAGDYLQICVKATDKDNCVIINIGGGTTNNIHFYNVVAGVATEFGSSSASIDADTDYTFEVIVSGTSLTFNVNGTSQGGGTIPTTQTGTKAGLGSAVTATAGVVSIDSFEQTA